MSILMQAPSAATGPVVLAAAMPSGNSYVADSEGQILAHSADVAALSGLGFIALIVPSGKSIATTAYTLKAADLNRKLAFTAASAITLTVPDGLVAAGVDADVLVQQVGAGAITVSGTNIENRQSHTDSAGQWAMMSLSTVPGLANTWILGGDTA